MHKCHFIPPPLNHLHHPSNPFFQFHLCQTTITSLLHILHIIIANSFSILIITLYNLDTFGPFLQDLLEAAQQPLNPEMNNSNPLDTSLKSISHPSMQGSTMATPPYNDYRPIMTTLISISSQNPRKFRPFPLTLKAKKLYGGITSFKKESKMLGLDAHHTM